MKAFFSFLFSLKTILFVLLGLALLAGGGYAYYYWQNSAGSGPGFRTEPVARHKLTATISATGTIEPEEVIDVGAQIAGQVLKFGKDPTDSSGKRDVDYCTPVEEGTVLAVIDDSLYASRVGQVQASLKNAQATLSLQKAKQWQADQDLKRAERQMAQGVQALAQADYDAAVATSKSADATVEVAQAGVTQAEANLKEAKINLGYCTITSPVKGVIIDRRVNVGQTVVASLSAPSIFLIAKDLMRLQVWASVNEADIGNIHIGQDVTFTVDARPNMTFKGVVQQIRYNATMTQNVVTYTVVVSTDNKVLDSPSPVPVTTPSGRTLSTGATELELMPYLTANLTFHVAERPDALLVPNAALRWHPQLTQVGPDYRSDYEQSLKKRAAKDAPATDPAGSSPDKPPAKKEGGSNTHGIVWVPDGSYVRPIRLSIGLTDGSMTEVVQVLKDDTLDEGTPLITGETQARGGSATTNPFAPPPIFRPQQPKKQE
jgi:HlyD family secretion protein